MPRANSPTNNIKRTLQTVNSNNAEELDRYDQDELELHGNGAGDRYSNDNPGKFEEQDRAAGGGKSPKVEEVKS